MSLACNTPLDRLLNPIARCLTPDVARLVAELRPDAGTQSRIDELAAKADAGSLTAAERLEYEGYVEAIDLVSILQAKARKALLARRV